MSFSSYQNPENLFAVFNHARQCIGENQCTKPGCIEMKSTFSHMDNCSNRNCQEPSCYAANRMRECVWGDYLKIYQTPK